MYHDSEKVFLLGIVNIKCPQWSWKPTGTLCWHVPYTSKLYLDYTHKGRRKIEHQLTAFTKIGSTVLYLGKWRLLDIVWIIVCSPVAYLPTGHGVQAFTHLMSELQENEISVWKQKLAHHLKVIFAKVGPSAARIYIPLISH